MCRSCVGLGTGSCIGSKTVMCTVILGAVECRCIMCRTGDCIVCRTGGLCDV